jgi:hypothetical protein
MKIPPGLQADRASQAELAKLQLERNSQIATATEARSRRRSQELRAARRASWTGDPDGGIAAASSGTVPGRATPRAGGGGEGEDDTEDYGFPDGAGDADSDSD